MTRALRLAVLVCATLGALVLSGPALAAFTPHFVVTATPPNASANSTTIQVAETRDEDALAKVTFYVPLDWQGALGQAAGTQIGTVNALVQATAISPDALLTITGVIVTDDPAKYATPATQCTLSPTHSAVWLLQLQAAGQQLAVPVYLDAITAGPEADFAKVKAQICLPPPAQATFGAKVLSAALTVTGGALTAPSAPGEYVWPAFFTPYATASGPTNPAGTVQSRAVVRLPGQVTLAAKLPKKKHVATVGGSVTENLIGVAGAKVTLFFGTSARKLKKTRAVSTGAGGTYSFKAKVAKVGYFRVQADVPARELGAAGCNIPVKSLPPAPAGCVSATASSFTLTSSTAVVRARK